MTERLYTEYPALYDAIQSDWDYDRDIAFIQGKIAEFEVGVDRVLEIGCGTGEHTRRLLDAGFDVTALDKYQGMLDIARTKCNADFRQAVLPEIPDEGPFDLAVLLRGVINHLPPEDLSLALEAVKSTLDNDGMVIFDNSPLPSGGNHPALDVGTTEAGQYARIAQHVPLGDNRLDWRAITFLPDGEFFVNSRKMTPFDDERITIELEQLGFEVDRYSGFGPEDDRTVFIGRPQ